MKEFILISAILGKVFFVQQMEKTALIVLFFSFFISLFFGCFWRSCFEK